MQKYIWVVVYVILIVMVSGCEDLPEFIDRNYPEISYTLEDESNTTWIFSAHSYDAGEEQELKILDQNVPIIGDDSYRNVYFEKSIKAQSPLIISFKSTKYEFTDTLNLPVPPYIFNVCVNGVPLVENDTNRIEVDPESQYLITWNSTLPFESEFAQSDSLMLVQRINEVEYGYHRSPYKYNNVASNNSHQLLIELDSLTVEYFSKVLFKTTFFFGDFTDFIYYNQYGKLTHHYRTEYFWDGPRALLLENQKQYNFRNFNPE